MIFNLFYLKATVKKKKKKIHLSAPKLLIFYHSGLELIKLFHPSPVIDIKIIYSLIYFYGSCLKKITKYNNVRNFMNYIYKLYVVSKCWYDSFFPLP